ncbi:phosphate acyltransferase PlsX [Williamsoniiplasma lucivorax]|uniref:Phosphate acyltransferase n=1 Tax=Williamsoniiplasma lucivorax TaxID=209274 RepID=A0A2S5R9S2_9MOLU|nr:phosphate acyltransferase PlsX [Williamsoniiplasma lucivorax]PPE04076.1 glycerol-3-phosphate acyltransferase PlsX [Williamsoniiplasma lucivorax]
MYKIAFDVMGSDLGPKIAVESALEFLKNKKDLMIVFVGDKTQIESVLKEEKNVDPSQYEIFSTTEVIDMHGSIFDVKRKKDASLVRALELVKDKQVHGMLTGGNSGAFLAGSHFILGELPGITRPGFMPTFPTAVEGKVTLFLDAGANNDNSAEDLYNYAKLATTYSKAVLGVKSPEVGLLNVGTEEGKGKDLQKDAWKLLTADKSLNYKGYIESREMLTGVVDIMVTDGFSGNIALKAMEGTSKLLLTTIKATVMKSFVAKMGALLMRGVFKEVKRKFDYKDHAGAILIGANGIVFKSHGSNDIQGFVSTLRMTYDAVKNDVLVKMKKEMGIQ